MPKNRISYNCQALYIGPSPSSGFHFIDSNGNLNNNTAFSANNFNLIKRITRATNLSYSINLGREEIKQIGRSTIAAHPVINNPNITVDFEYYPNGVINEARLGFNVNHTIISGINSGQALYQNNFNNFIFSGLKEYKDNTQPLTSPYWPAINRSCKNIFATITKEENKDEIFINDLSIGQENFRNTNVIAFGDAYINNYTTSCAVGNLPKGNASFVADNIIFYSSSSGEGIPAINPKNGINFSGVKFVVPAEPDIQDLSVIAPGDIIVDISQTGNGSEIAMNNITDFGVRFSDIKLQNYSINIQFEREELTSIGYKAPSIRRINFPVKVDLSFSAIVGDETAANLTNLIANEKQYNIAIKMKQRNSSEILIRYDFIKAFLEEFNYNSSIDNNRILDFSLRVYCSPDDLSQGLFISGQIPNQNLRIPY